MPLEAAEIQELEQARASALQAKGEADKAWTAAHTAKNAIPESRAAVQTALAAASAAEQEAENAAKLAERLKEKLDESIRLAKKANREAMESAVAAKVRLESAQQQLSTARNKLSAAENAVESTASDLKAAEVPSTMQDRLNRLQRDAEPLRADRDEKRKAQLKAVSEIEAAKKAFDEQTRIGDEARCQQGYISYYLSGPPVLEGEKTAKAALETLQLAKPASDEALSESERVLEAKEAEIRAQQKKLKERNDAFAEAKKKADKAVDELDKLKGDLQDLQQRVDELSVKCKAAVSREKAKGDELDRLESLVDLDTVAAKTLDSAQKTHAEALALCDARGLIAERLDADVDSGAVFANLSDGQKRAVRLFNRGSNFGAAARRLAPALDGLSEAQFLQAMANEPQANHSVKLTKKPGGGQQQMQKWEFADGTVIRYKPEGDEYSGGAATYSIEVKINRNVADQNLADIGFKVDPQGRAVPKAPANLNNPYPGGDKKADYRDQAMRLGHRPL